MTSSQRPRPRARKASSSAAVYVSPAESVASTLKSTISPPLASARAVSQGKDDDDDDDFFTRKKVLPAPTLDVDIAEESEADTDPEEHIQASSSDVEGHRRKRVRRHMSSWTKSASFSRVKSGSRQPSINLNEGLLDDDMDVPSHSHDSMHSRSRTNKSPSLTPPPDLDPQLIVHLKTILNQHSDPKAVEVLEDDDEMPPREIGRSVDLDPDLARMIRGDRAREQRKQAKEREARLREEEERNRKAQPVQKPSSPPSADVIEVVDSDDDRPSRQAQGNAQRHRDSSSPVEIVSLSMPARGEMQTRPTVAPVPAREASPESVDEEDERLSLVMKGGEGGRLEAKVIVRPTTQIKKLLDHFKTLHKDAIPKAKLNLVKLRFDGDLLSPKVTVGDAGIEDDEQLDVIW